MNIIIKDSLRDSVERASEGKQTIIRTSKGYPSYFSLVQAFDCEDIHPTSFGTGRFPAFVINGVEKSEIFIASYQAIVCDGQAISLPFQSPKTNINFDQARAACVAAGPGFHLMTNWEWSAVALWMTKNGYSDIHGNTNYGKSHKNSEEFGIPSGEYQKTLTGSGPDSWRHDGSPYGINDLVGNIWEWCDGLKLSAGKIIMPRDNDYAADESTWNSTGAVITSEDGDGIQISNKITNAKRGWLSAAFTDITASTDQQLPVSIYQALLCPCDDSLGISGHVWADNTKGLEVLPLRSGNWSYTSSCGLAALYLGYTRADVGGSIGFRPAFIG